MKLDQEQIKAVLIFKEWYKKKSSRYLTMGGYAGTGKTTVIAYIRKMIKDAKLADKVAFCAYTGKAAIVLKEKLKALKILNSTDTVGTIHSLIYSAIVDEKTDKIIGWERRNSISADLIIVDEASMVDEKIWNDLITYNIPIFAVGDHGQLPPISGKFNLMQKPMLKLETIHRQKGENPIVDISKMARETGDIPIGIYGDNVKKLDRSDPYTGELVESLLQGFSKDTLVICGYNHTRIKLNKYIRGLLGFDSEEPMINDRVICLKNNYKTMVFNGMLGNILNLTKEEINENIKYFKAEIELDYVDKPYNLNINPIVFNNADFMNSPVNKGINLDLFDFGYALTVHKSQGSQARKVILFEERFKQMEDDMWRKWLYTAVTRAEEELYIIG